MKLYICRSERRPRSKWTPVARSCNIARMKKAQSGKRNPVAKSSSSSRHDPPKNTTRKSVALKPAARKPTAPKLPAAKSVDEYFDRLQEPALSALYKMRQAIQSSVPAEAIEFISYGVPAFKLKRVLVWYAAFANHCSLFPTNAVIEAFKEELKSYTTSKGTIHFPLDKPMPVALIRKLVKTRVAQDASGMRRRKK